MYKEKFIKIVNIKMKKKKKIDKKIWWKIRMKNITATFSFLNFWVVASFFIQKTGTDCNE